MEQKLTHFDEAGNAIMVDVSDKQITSRTAIAKGSIQVNPRIMRAIVQKEVKKGDVRQLPEWQELWQSNWNWELIPMCHQLMIQKCSVDFEVNEEAGMITAVCTAKVEGKTGVEMEALTGVQIALLTIYDMCKAIDKSMTMTDIHLVEKTGGKSGTFQFAKE